MHPLAKKIASLQRRLAFRQRAMAACRTAATVIAVALLLGSIDYAVRFSDPGLRIMATAALVAAAAWAVYRWWYLPGRRRLIPLVVARRVESHFPQLNDLLASALEFLQQSEEDRMAGSAQLRRLVVAEAEAAVEGLPLDEVIDRRPLRRAAACLVAAGAAAGLCLVVDSAAVGTALARLAAPLGSTQWPRQHHLAFRDAPTRLAVGQTFEAELIDTAGQLPDEVRIEYQSAYNGRREVTSEPMTRSGDAMVARRENVRHSFAFRAEGGDDNGMPWNRVEVVEPPQLQSLTITVHPPAYTGLRAVTAERHLQVLAGTAIEVTGAANKPLRTAHILLDGVEPIAATIAADSAGHERRGFHVSPDRWIAAKSGAYSLELADAEGVAGVVGRWNLRVEPDSPPSVSWQRPSDDLYVTAAAAVPIELVVKDNLAVRRVDLVYERSDSSKSERKREQAEIRVELYRGPEKPAPIPSQIAATGGRASSEAMSTRGESRVVEAAWELAPLLLPVGAEVRIEAEAVDYRPGIGRTIAPRRVTVITPAELETRLADRQAQIVRHLERALAIEQATREGVRRLAIQQRDAGSLAGGDRNALQTAELNQRRVDRMLIDPAEGVPALIDSIVTDIEINRVASAEIHETMDRLTAELQRLAADPLSVAERELTTARKTVEEIDQSNDDADDAPRARLDDTRSAAVSSSLTASGAAQDDVIATLERLISELSGKADYRRFARQLAELREDQMAHEQAVRAEIGLETLPLRVSELTRAQRAGLNKAAAGQDAIAIRFEKIEQGMDRLAQELAEEESNAAETLAEAVEMARRLAIGAQMHQTARDLSENRVGGALARESQIAEEIQHVLNVLRRQDERRTEQVAEKLRNAEKQLAALRDQLATLREQITRAERPPATAPIERQLDPLNQQQQALRRDIEKLAQRLERLRAADAGKSTRSAADRLNNGGQNESQPPANTERQSSSSQVQKAEQDLEKAARQLAQRRQQAEDDLALEFVRRFQAELTKMVERQGRVIHDSAQLDSGRQPNEPPAEMDLQAIAKLAGEERQLAEMAKEHSELLFGLGAVRVSLEDAQRRLAAAAMLLDERDTGPKAQRAERHALARLEGMMEAFAQTASDAAQNQGGQPAAGAAIPPPPRRPTFELLEVKMLRMLQIDLNERTREYQQSLAKLDTPLGERQRANMQREAEELAAEQGRLAELVENMLTRDNER